MTMIKDVSYLFMWYKVWTIIHEQKHIRDQGRLSREPIAELKKNRLGYLIAWKRKQVK